MSSSLFASPCLYPKIERRRRIAPLHRSTINQCVSGAEGGLHPFLGNLDTDRTVFLDTLAQTAERVNWVCHAYCLMTNHYLCEASHNIITC